MIGLLATTASGPGITRDDRGFLETGELRVCRKTNGIWNPQGPASSDRYTVFIDGEFNYRHDCWKALGGRPAEIPVSDQEIVLAFLTRGLSLDRILPYLEGSFVLLVVDHVAQTLHVANDRFGSRPHYTIWRNGEFTISPAISSCLSLSGLRAELDVQSVAEWFLFQCVLNDRTLFSQVELLPAATVLTLDLKSRQLSYTTYENWAGFADEQSVLTFAEAVEATESLIVRACRQPSADAHRVGLYLSGGLDSRLLLAAADPDTPVATFSYGPADSPDLVFARRCASLKRTAHHEMVMHDGQWILDILADHTTLTEGGHSVIHGQNFWRAGEVGAHMDVNLHGHFGDLLMGGSYLFEGGAETLLPDLRHTFLRRWGAGYPEEEVFCRKMPGVAPDLSDRIRADFRRSLSAFEGCRPAVAHDLFALQYHGRKQLQYYIQHNRPHFESRTPFLDLDLVKLLFSLPPAFRADRRLQIAVLDSLSPELARIPWAGTNLPAVNKGLAKVRARISNSVNGLSARWFGVKPVSPAGPLLSDIYPVWLQQSGADVQARLQAGVLQRLFSGDAFSDEMQCLEKGGATTGSFAARIGLLLTLAQLSRQFGIPD